MKNKIKKETMAEYIERGGKVKKLPDELPWKMFPQPELIKLHIPILDYERDHKLRGSSAL
jgi:hypothetical protein